MDSIRTRYALFGCAAALACGLTAASTTSQADDSIQFTRDVRPILAEKCFACHGPDSATREEGIRFDTQDGLFAVTEMGIPYVAPGDPEESEIYYRLTADDPEEHMPPEDSHPRPTAAEIVTIKRWIEQGAPWEGHWAFIPPEKPARPDVSDPAWPTNEIDYFILRRLDEAGLKPSKEARKETLIRRLSLDLIGLPPGPKEVDAFLADESPGAYEKIVDRLLASPHYGERMAFPWLDLARYADTSGYQRDTKRTMWPWRDWVIDAFNENMPFDRFTIEQLAGDLLPNATTSQIVATGFNRNHRINGEGGIIPEEYAVEYVVDRVNTTSTAWMGLTMTCARCHDHKFDPLSQKEFYEMFAFFNRVPEDGKGLEVGNDKPFIQLPTEADREFQAGMTSKIDALDSHLYRSDDALDALQRRSEPELSKIFATLNWEVLGPTRFSAANGTTLELLDDGSILAGGTTPDNEQYEVSFRAENTIRALKLDLLMDDRLSESGPGRGDTGNVILTDFIVQRVSRGSGTPETLEVVDAFADYARMDSDYAIDKAIDDDPDTGWSIGAHLERDNRKAIFTLGADSTIQTGDIVTVTLKHESKFSGYNAGRFKLSGTSTGDIADWAKSILGSWHYLGPFPAKGRSKNWLEAKTGPEAGYEAERSYGKGALRWRDKPEWDDLGTLSLKAGNNTITFLHRTIDVAIPTLLSLSFGSNDGIKIWIDGEVQFTKDLSRGTLFEPDTIPLYLAEGRHDLLIKVANDVGFNGFSFLVQDDGGENLLALIDWLAVPESERTDEERRGLQRIFRSQNSEWREKSLELSAMKTELSDYERGITSTMVMEDMLEAPDTYLLRRGAYDQPDASEKLNASVPAVLGEMDPTLPKNRLGFAQWLVDPKHPLTARVRVNQFWQMYFGRGIVKTSEDFGTQSTAPSHPELLDYLAIDFVESGWDVKAMQKKIVMSATYRQDSAATEAYRQADPENVLLGRAPRYRLSAAMIRDQALSVSGLLNSQIGGPSVYPYQPENMWSALSFQNKDEYDTNYYEADTGDALYRRGLYTYWKRTIAPPRMQIFDAADRERCSIRRDITNTPLQAMALLNDPTYIEASRHLAERMIREGGKKQADRIRWGYKLALAYEPDADRFAILERGLDTYTQHFKKHKADAKAFLSVGDSEYDDPRAARLAAYTMLASVILNLDETITRQ